MSDRESLLLAARLIRARNRAGLDQSQVASRSGLTQSYISQLERAEHGNPGWRHLRKIEKAIGVKAGYLTADEPAPRLPKEPTS